MRKERFTSVFERLRPRLFAKARAVLSDDEDARDVIQDAFFKLWQTRLDFERESHAEGVLVTTVRNLSIDRLRRQSSHPASPLYEKNCHIADCDTETESRNETYRQVELLINAHLSPRDREILMRRDRDEWEFSDIAEHFYITEANARLIVARARKTIRTLYSQKQQ